MQMKIKILILTVLILMSFVSCARKSAQDEGNGSDTVPSAASSDVITQIGTTDTAEAESEHTDGQSGVTTSPSGDYSSVTGSASGENLPDLPSTDFYVPDKYPPDKEMTDYLPDYKKVNLKNSDYNSLLEFCSGDSYKILKSSESDFLLTFYSLPSMVFVVEYNSGSDSHSIISVVTGSFSFDCSIPFSISAGGLRILKTDSLTAVGYDLYMGYYYVISDTGYLKLGSEKSFSDDVSSPATSFVYGEETYSLSLENGELHFTASLVDRISHIYLQHEEYLFSYLNKVSDLDRGFEASGVIREENGTVKAEYDSVSSISDYFKDRLQSIYEKGFSSGILPAEDNIYSSWSDYLDAKENGVLPSQNNSRK